jgi:hypothetical protein
MEQLQLTDEQKALLRLIAMGLKSRRRHDDPWWIRMAHDHSMPVWQNVRNPRTWCNLQEHIDLGALIVLERLGFIINAGPGHYALDERRIIEAVERNFAPLDSAPFARS